MVGVYLCGSGWSLCESPVVRCVCVFLIQGKFSAGMSRCQIDTFPILRQGFSISKSETSDTSPGWWGDMAYVKLRWLLGCQVPQCAFCTTSCFKRESVNIQNQTTSLSDFIVWLLSSGLLYGLLRSSTVTYLYMFST